MTTQRITKSDLDDIEALIDRAGVSALLDAISDICYGKAGHLEENWQDANSAKVWERAGKAIDKAASHQDVLALD
jgi:hypothetical protein